MHKMIVTTTAALFFSCAIDVEDKGSRRTPGTTPSLPTGTPGQDSGQDVSPFPDNPGPHGFALEAARPDRPTPLGTVRPGDRVLVRISGAILRPRLGEPHTRKVSSRWIFRECWRPDPDRWEEDNCRDHHRAGTCEIRYRDFLGLESGPLEFPGEAPAPGFRLGLGGNSYRVERIVARTPREIVTEFTVAPEMLPGGGPAELTISPPPPEGIPRPRP